MLFKEHLETVALNIIGSLAVMSSIKLMILHLAKECSKSRVLCVTLLRRFPRRMAISDGFGSS